MLRYIYGFPLDEQCDEIPGKEQFDYLFVILCLIRFFLSSLYYNIT